MINMKEQEKLYPSKTEIKNLRVLKIIFPIAVTTIVALFVPTAVPLIGMLMFGNLITSKYSENENAIISNSNFFVPTGDTFIVEPVSFIISNEGVLVSVRSAEFRTFRETEKRLQMNLFS